MPIATTSSSPLRSVDDAGPWLNAEPLHSAGMRGYVVLVQFWTYSCVNWLRTLPYIGAWHRRYGSRGLTVIGVHAPEFDFEHELANVRRASAELGVEHPVLIDNEFRIWRSFENRYWPALFLLDEAGRVRFHHAGEGFYKESEQAIQQLLGVEEALTDVDPDGLTAPADLAALRSPETYLGAARGERRAGRGMQLGLNEWDLAGVWSVGSEAATLDSANGSILCRFSARDVNLVLAPPPGAAVPFVARLDRAAAARDRGVDLDESGAGIVLGPRMYQLIRRRRAGTPATFEIEFSEPGVRAYVFTFG